MGWCKVPPSTMQAQNSPPPAGTLADTRCRILDAAFAIFMEHGYAGTSTLAIATRARVSKRSLYQGFGNKAGLLTALIAERTAGMVALADMPPPRSREALTAALRAFGAGVLSRVTLPTTLAIFRLAIQEAERAPELARVLDRHGRQPVQDAAQSILRGAAGAGIVRHDVLPAMTGVFFGVLQHEVIMSLLLGLRTPPDENEIARLADAAARAAMALSQPEA